MRKKKDNSVIYDLVWCILIYIGGVLLLVIFQDYLFPLGLFFIATLFIIPTLIEAKKKLTEYAKKRRIEKLRKTRETIIVGGTPQKHHKKKRQQGYVIYPTIDDSVSKGKVMRELGLFYEKKQKKVPITAIAKPTKPSTPGRTYRQLNELFDALNYHKRIRITHHANIGPGHHGGSIKRMVEAEAKRRGVSISVRVKGKDIIIEAHGKNKG